MKPRPGGAGFFVRGTSSRGLKPLAMDLSPSRENPMVNPGSSFGPVPYSLTKALLPRALAR